MLGFFPWRTQVLAVIHLRLWCQHLEPGCSSEPSVIRRDSALLDALAKPRGLMVTACESGFSNCFLVGRFPFYTPKSLMVWETLPFPNHSHLLILFFLKDKKKGKKRKKKNHSVVSNQMNTNEHITSRIINLSETKPFKEAVLDRYAWNYISNFVKMKKKKKIKNKNKPTKQPARRDTTVMTTHWIAGIICA